MADNKKTQGKKKNVGFGWLVFLAIILISNLMNSADSGSFRHLLFRLRLFALRLGVPVEALLLAPVAVIVLIVLLVSAAKRRAREKDADTPTMKKARASAAVQRPDPRSRSFTGPDAYCFTCEATGEDHFQRDKHTRIKQLDEWLKNGLIDRAEYQVLKARYERNL